MEGMHSYVYLSRYSIPICISMSSIDIYPICPTLPSYPIYPIYPILSICLPLEGGGAGVVYEVPTGLGNHITVAALLCTIT